MKDILLMDIMVTNVVTAHVIDKLSDVEKKMKAHRIRHIPVVAGEDNILLGIITHWDIRLLVPPHRTEEGEDVLDMDQLDTFILEKVMTKDPVTLHPDDSVRHAVEIMARDKYGCIPIVLHQNELVGIVTQSDILRLLARWLNNE